MTIFQHNTLNIEFKELYGNHSASVHDSIARSHNSIMLFITRDYFSMLLLKWFPPNSLGTLFSWHENVCDVKKCEGGSLLYFCFYRKSSTTWQQLALCDIIPFWKALFKEIHPSIGCSLTQLPLGRGRSENLFTVRWQCWPPHHRAAIIEKCRDVFWFSFM